MIKEATFTSVWENGIIETDCKVNMETKEVFNIEVVECDCDNLEKEYITIEGEEYPVYQKDEAEDGDYWYE